MKKMFISCAAILALMVTGEVKADTTLKIGVVNFKTCIEKSKLGKAEQAAFEALKEQMVTVLEKTEKELDDLASKLGDEDHLDSLSQDAQNELKVKFQGLNQELARYQNQYYQILNQANFKLISDLTSKVAEASQNVAKNNGYSLILNEEATFFKDPSLEITNDIIVELDKRFDEEEKEFQKNATQPAKS